MDAVKKMRDEVKHDIDTADEKVVKMVHANKLSYPCFGTLIKLQGNFFLYPAEVFHSIACCVTLVYVPNNIQQSIQQT